MKKRTRELQQTREQQEQEQIDITQDLRAQHMSNQSKDARKRMKRNLRKSKRYNDGKGTFFAAKWLRSFHLALQKTFKRGGKG